MDVYGPRHRHSGDSGAVLSCWYVIPSTQFHPHMFLSHQVLVVVRHATNHKIFTVFGEVCRLWATRVRDLP